MAKGSSNDEEHFVWNHDHEFTPLGNLVENQNNRINEFFGTNHSTPAPAPQIESGSNDDVIEGVVTDL